MEGGCLCEAIRYTVDGPVKSACVCHCGQCRKQSGHVWSSAFAPREKISVTGDVRWYDAKGTAKRGFCPTCGSFLFWAAHDEDTMSFSLGSLDAPTGLTLEKHIFTSDKGDYYDISDGLPQK
jgi:hypothetical protein